MSPPPSPRRVATPAPPVLARVERDGAVEAEHRGHLAVTDHDGKILGAVGDPHAEVYIRSAAKPFQALAVLELLAIADQELDPAGLAIACASHTGSDHHQVEAARLLALAGLDESALACPADYPADPQTRSRQPDPSPLAHNCSGKHAAFLLAHTAAGEDPATYLSPATPLQQRVRANLRRLSGAAPTGPGVDGCGAPAWRLPLHGLATAFARLAAAEADDRGGLGRVRDAMVALPHLVGGVGTVDTGLMWGDARVVAKRGAEGLLGVGVRLDDRGIGMALKIADGAARPTGPVVAAALAGWGIRVPEELRSVPVLGGSQVRGHLTAVVGLPIAGS